MQKKCSPRLFHNTSNETCASQATITVQATMLQRKYESRIKSIKNPFTGIYTLEFESLDRPYKYHPGQFLHLSIDNDYDGSGQWPESRCFSMQSNPSEETIRITYAVKGQFTQEMEQTLKEGRNVWLKLPYGDLFQQPHNKENTVFIAGGTGITPFLSLFTHETFNAYSHPNIYLGFRSKEYNIYEAALSKVCNAHKQVHTFYETNDGVIDIETICSENGTASTYFISGPPIMITEFKQRLMRNGVPENQIKTDDWA